MAETPSETQKSYAASLLGGAGEAYSRLIVMWLFTRAVHENDELKEKNQPVKPFKLAIEIIDGNKFDDIGYYDGSTDEWLLIQAKHATIPKQKPTKSNKKSTESNQKSTQNSTTMQADENQKVITLDALFPKKPASSDFSIPKYFESHLQLQDQKWKYGGVIKQLYLFTNKRLQIPENTQKTIVKKSEKVNGMLKFAAGEHCVFLPLKAEHLEALKEHVACQDLIRLFKAKNDSDKVEVILKKIDFKRLRDVLEESNNVYKFSEGFLKKKSNHKFFEFIQKGFEKQDLSKLSLGIPKEFSNLLGDSIDKNDTSSVKDTDVEEFFDKFVLSCSQPNAIKIAEEIQNVWDRWMRGWIRPNVFRKLTENQLQEPFFTFIKFFFEWETPWVTPENRLFLTDADGVGYLEVVKKLLKEYIEQHSRHQGLVGLDAAEKYYVERSIAFEKRSKSSEKIDEKFVDWLYDEWKDCTESETTCIVLFAEPGMGKSTLWQQLAFRTQQKYRDVEVFLIHLNDLTVNLDTIDEKTSARDAVKIMKSIISDEHMKRLLDTQRTVFVFFDAFDELKEEHKPTIFSFINAFIRDQPNVKFLISSRERSEKALRENFSVKNIYVQSFNDEERLEFLKKFWGAKIEFNPSKFDPYAKMLLAKFREDVPRGDISFIGLPLTMKMLAEVYRDSFEKYNKSTTMTSETALVNVSISIISLYEQFTRKCVSLRQIKDLGISNVANFEKQGKLLIDNAVKHYQIFAMNQMNLGVMIENKDKPLLKNFYESIGKGEAESLLLETVNNRPRFSHRSYAEFFIAKYLYDHIQNIDEAHFKPTIEGEIIVRKFFLKMVDTAFNSNQQESSNDIQKHLEILDNIGEKVEIWASEDNCGMLLTKAKETDKIRTHGEQKTTLLHIAARANACEAMVTLLKPDVNIDVEIPSEEYDYITPLVVASDNGNLEMVKLLVDKGANKDYGLDGMRGPLFAAAKNGHYEIVNFLTSESVKVNLEHTTFIPLHVAAEKGYAKVVQLLVERGASFDRTNSENQTALHIAAIHGQTSVVEVLSNKTAILEAQDNKGNTALHNATKYGHVDVVKQLVKKGANVKETNNKTRTPLQIAKRMADSHDWIISFSDEFRSRIQDIIDILQ